MNRLQRIVTGLTMLLTSASPVLSFSAQTPEENAVEVIERIKVQSGGNVDIIIPDKILEQIFTEPESRKSVHKDNIRPGINKLQGFRIQVFSDGQNQHSLESRAKARGSAIVARFPKFRGQVYTFSSSPNWYTRVGNFRTQQEASEALRELKLAFPSFASEMRVVRSQIIVIK